MSEHVWVRGYFCAEDERECGLCGCASDEPAADQPCKPIYWRKTRFEKLAAKDSAK